VVDEGARRALVERGTSLLPAGVVAVEGDFDEEAIVAVVSRAGETIARGMVLCDADTLRTVMGRRTTDLPAEMAHEVVHRDDLVLLA
jgi:glutamate 5-kinase